MLEASWQCVAPYGRFIEIGKVDIRANSSLPMAGFAKNVSFCAVDMHDIAINNKEGPGAPLVGQNHEVGRCLSNQSSNASSSVPRIPS